MHSVFIEDGYSLDATLPSVPGLYPALRVRYRPALAQERFTHLQARDFDGLAQSQRLAALVERHIETWDAKDARAETVPPKADKIARLHPNLLIGLVDLILGYSAPQQEADAKN